MREIGLALLLTPHLLLVDLAMVGPLACVAIRWRADAWGDGLARRLAWLSLLALLAGSVLGGVLLGMHYLAGDGYFQALAVVPRDRLWFALFELLFSFACLGAYVALWNRWRQRRILHSLLALAGATNLMAHFPALFVAISLLRARPELPREVLERAEYRQLLFDPQVLSRVAHVWLAAVAVTALVVAALATWSRTDDATTPTRIRLVRRNAWLALAATLLQLPAGVWLALQMPDSQRAPLMGADWLASGLFLAALTLTFPLMNVLAAIGLGDVEPARVRRAMLVLVALVSLMVGTRVRLTQVALRSEPPAAATALASGAVSGPMDALSR